MSNPMTTSPIVRFLPRARHQLDHEPSEPDDDEEHQRDAKQILRQLEVVEEGALSPVGGLS
jgi:hypothetical protein